MSEIDDRIRTQLQVEDFLWQEAELLDQWRLDEWLALFAADCRYIIGPTGLADAAELSPETSLFLVSDDRFRLEQRVVRLKKPTAHAEFPHSRTRHLYGNVQVLGDDGQGRVKVGLNFATWRTARGITHQFIGRTLLELQRLPQAGDSAQAFSILSKRITLDLDSLVPQGKVTILL